MRVLRLGVGDRVAGPAAVRAGARAAACAGLTAAALLWAAVAAQAAPQALLVGVSGYPSLPEARRLRGPRNDVPLMREALLRAGMPADGIRMLADGVPGSAALPTRGAILAGMDALAAHSQPGDWVVVYFSGHGSQQPQPPLSPGSTRYREPDGLDEIFLPYDIGHWDGRLGAVQGALVDDDIGTALDAISARGARVWAIFDTCHAGDMARTWHPAQPGTVYRTVPPEALGVPAFKAAPAASRRALPSPAASALDTPGAGRVVFYASHPDEPAAEEPLPEPLPGLSPLPPAGRPTAALKVYGYFTYLVAQELGRLGRQPIATLGTLAERVAQRYASRPYPTPLFEGNLKQVADFSQTGLTKAPPPAPGSLAQAVPPAAPAATPPPTHRSAGTP